MDVPSIKGTGIAQVVADVVALLERGSIERAALEARLEAEDLALLDQKIHVGDWYPNACHRRLTELLRDVEGGGREDYVVQRGSATADRLLEAGLYRQLRLVDDDAAAGSEQELRRAVRIMLSLAGSLYSFGHWALQDGDSPVLRVVVSEAADLSDMNRLTAQGFIGRIAERILGYTPEVASRWLTRDRAEVTLRFDPERTR